MSVCLESSMVDASRVVQLRAVFWSMRKAVDAAQAQAGGGKAWLFELGQLADAGIALADSAIEEATPR